jgi:hypothetical protein
MNCQPPAALFPCPGSRLLARTLAGQTAAGPDPVAADAGLRRRAGARRRQLCQWPVRVRLTARQAVPGGVRCLSAPCQPDSHRDGGAAVRHQPGGSGSQADSDHATVTVTGLELKRAPAKP